MNSVGNLALVNEKPACVLVVDDDSMLRTLIRVKLSKSGYSVLEAEQGQQAIEMFNQEQPDIVLMDANMPGMNGFEATAAIKQTEKGTNIPILMVSGLEDDESVDRAFSVGATEYITKPICWPLLIHRLANICAAITTETKIIQAKLDADRANQSKSEFLANMSHELRTPMHAILSFASMGLEKYQTAPAEKLNRYFSRIDESGNRLLLLLNDLLDLSKLESGAMGMNIASHDMAETVEMVRAELSGLISARKIQLVIQTPTVVTSAEFDCDKIFQVIRNLLSNAIKFTSEGKSIFVEFSDTHIEDDQINVDALKLSVVDQGVGIPDNELVQVFDKFVQSSKTKTGAGGTGLGLAISKQIIECHNGQIYAKNNEYGGVSFHFVIPREQKQGN